MKTILNADWLQNLFRLTMTNSQSHQAAMLASSPPVDKMEQSFMSRVSQLTSRWLEYQEKQNILFKMYYKQVSFIYLLYGVSFENISTKYDIFMA